MKYNKKYNLTSDPRSLSLKLPTMMINKNNILVESNDNIEEDTIFSKKYLQFLNGKKNAYITRMSLDKIQKGFYKRDNHNKKWVYSVDSVNKEHLSIKIRDIKIGNRPLLHIYENPNKKSSFLFLCPDDVIIYEAYENLNIRKVPVIILGTKKYLEESAFIQKMFPDKNINENSYLIYSNINITKKSYHSILGENFEDNIGKGIYRLEVIFIQLKNSLKKFHLEGKLELHYHEMMYSVILRIIEMLKSIRLLLEEGLTFQACTILRSLYELSLNYYLSWLSPNEMALVLQNSNTMSELEWKKVSEYLHKERLSNGLNEEFANDIKKVLQYQYSFSSKVIEKSKLTPLGEYFYNEIYTFLSDITHHDFSMVARYKNALEHGDEVIYDSDILKSIHRITDAVVSMVYLRMKDDIGNID